MGKADGSKRFLNNGGAWLVDAKPVYHMDGGNGSPNWSLSFSSLYGLPFGPGAWLGGNTHGVFAELISDWQLDWIFQNRAGNAIGVPTGDIFYCGKYNIKSQHRGYGNYINNAQESCWSHTQEYFIYTFDGTQTIVRQPWAQQTQLAGGKKFTLRHLDSGDARLQFKAEAFNATNTPIFGGPDTGSPENTPQRVTSVADSAQPGAWQGYGTVGSQQQNFPRQFQLSLKLEF